MGAVTHLPRLIRRRSRVRALVSLRSRAIANDTRIVQYMGQLVSQAEAQAGRREQQLLSRQGACRSSGRQRRVGRAGGAGVRRRRRAHYINHACHPKGVTSTAARSECVRLRANQNRRRADLPQHTEIVPLPPGVPADIL